MKWCRVFSSTLCTHTVLLTLLTLARRAAALLSRGWTGDAAFALRDCEAALRLEPVNAKAMHRRVQALQALRLTRVRCIAIQTHNLQ